MANAIIATNKWLSESGLDFSDSSTAIADYPATNMQIYQPGESYRTAVIEYAHAGVGTSATPFAKTGDLIGALYTNLTRHPNMLTESNDLDETDWTATNVTVTQDDVNSAAPLMNHSFTVDDDTASGEHSLFQDLVHLTQLPAQIGSAFATGFESQVFTGSFYVAQSVGDLDVRIRIESDTTHYMECSYDLSAGTAGTPAEDGSAEWSGGVATMTAVSAQEGALTWYRVTLKAQYDGGNDSSLGLRLMLENTGSVSYTGSDDVIYAQAAQLENAAAATTFVETTSDSAAFAAVRDSTTHRRGYAPVATTDLRDWPFVHVFHWFSSPVGMNRPNFNIWDPGNADAYVEVGNLIVAQSFQPAVNVNLGWTTGYIEDSDRTSSLGSQDYVSISGRKRVIGMTHEWLTETEAFDGASEIDRSIGSSEGVFASVDPSNAQSQRWSIFGTQETINETIHKRYSPSVAANVYSKAWRIIEALP